MPAQVSCVILGKSGNTGNFSVESKGIAQGNAFYKSRLPVCQVSLGQDKSSFIMTQFLLVPLACSGVFICKRS